MIESYAFILNILLFVRSKELDFVVSLLINLLISLGICSIPKLLK